MRVGERATWLELVNFELGLNGAERGWMTSHKNGQSLLGSKVGVAGSVLTPAGDEGVVGGRGACRGGKIGSHLVSGGHTCIVSATVDPSSAALGSAGSVVELV
jgi:hypothetical protein